MIFKYAITHEDGTRRVTPHRRNKAMLKTKRSDEQVQQAIHNAQVATGVKKRVTDAFHNEYGWVDPKCWGTSVYEAVELADVCQWGACSKPSQKRIAINVHGTVCEIDVCEDHKHMHGKWCDSPMESEHQQQMIREEEKGYARGLADAKLIEPEHKPPMFDRT